MAHSHTCGQRNTARNDDPDRVDASGAAGRSRTTSQITTPVSVQNIAPAIEVSRQPIHATASAAGPCPPMAPSVPASCDRPVSVVKRAGPNHWAASVSAAIQRKDEPRPISARPR
jgi:hypothetical protein